MFSTQIQRQENGALEAVAKKARFSASQSESPQRRMNDLVMAGQNSNPYTETATIDYQSPSELIYTGEAVIPITSFLHIVTPEEDAPRGIWPIFRIMDENGTVRNPVKDGYNHEHGCRHTAKLAGVPAIIDEKNLSPKDDDLSRLLTILERDFPLFDFGQNPLFRSAKHEYPDLQTRNTLIRAYTQMIRLRTMDTILQDAQRQGRISFYMTCRGEEAIHFGAATALTLEDTIFAQYREAGALMWRGFSLLQFADQCFSNESDLGRGRQMPVHYGSRALNYQTISSPLGTQLPQAVGAAYRSKLQGKKNISIAFFGEGCASTVDFHSACNFAATLKVPVIFFCRNNGYAISTSATEQYAGDGIISRCKGYGMAGVRVDGNDLLAVSAAVHAAKVYAVEHSAPVMIEAMTYRQGHHSTSDDSLRYRSEEEVRGHANHGDPLERMTSFLNIYGMLDENGRTRLEDAEKLAVLQAMETAEKKPPPHHRELFQDVYKDLPTHLEEQEEKLLDHISLYDGKY